MKSERSETLDFGSWILDGAALFLLLIVAALSSCAGTQKKVLHGTAGGPVVLAQSVTADTVISGVVTLAEDLLIPEGVTLSTLPGTVVTVVPSEGTRTESQFVTTETEIVVHGTLIFDKTSIGPQGGIKGTWGGIISSASKGCVIIRDSNVSGAQFGLMMLAGTAKVTGSIFENNETGIAAAPGSRIELAGNTYRDNDSATAAWHTDNQLKAPSDNFYRNSDDSLALMTKPVPVRHRGILSAIPAPPAVTREYLGDTALGEDTAWSGTVIVNGLVAVPPGVTLTIEPGTHVLFTFKDTNGDSLGESWIIVQGTIKILGNEDAWVLFDSEDENAKPGSWDSLSVIASDSDENVVSHTVFRRGVKAFHNHFSRAALDHVIFENNLRGIQFQESEETEITWALLRRNQSGARFRDSKVTLKNMIATDNVAGINFLRSRVTATDILITGSYAESFVSRESETTLTRAVITGNVTGPRFKGEGETVAVRETLVTGNLGEGLSFNNVRGTVRSSSVTGNGLTGLSVTDAELTVHGNRIAGNGRFEVDNNGSTEIDARGNDWGSGSAPDPKLIYDESDEAGIGRVLTSDPGSFSLLFPGMEPPPGNLEGELFVVGDVTTPPQREIIIEPGARVRFAVIDPDSLFDLSSDHPGFPRSELVVLGRISAEGSTERKIHFYQAGPASVEGPHWGSVNLANGIGGRFENCVFTNAATGIHARNAGDVSVKNCFFERNLVGLRFSSTNMTVSNSIFRYNDVGLRFHEYGGVVNRNTFERNNSAIFVTDNPDGVTLTDNIFRNSRDYHIKLGIHVTQDVVVRGGNFELGEGQTVGDMVFDKGDDKDLGKVIFLP